MFTSDADTLVYVVKREKMNRGIREDSETASDSEQQQGYVPELASLNEQQSSVKMTPHVLPMHNRVVPTFDLGENRNTLFSTTISAPFESATPNPLSPMGIKSDYEKFTPMGSPISIDDRPTTSNINYLQGLPQSPIEGQYMNPRSSVPENQTAGNYGPWPTPSFQHPIFNQVDYGNGNSGVIPQHFMSPMMPTPSHAPLPLQGARSQLPMDRTPIFPAFRDDT